MDKSCKNEMCKTCQWASIINGNVWNGYCRALGLHYAKVEIKTIV